MKRLTTKTPKQFGECNLKKYDSLINPRYPNGEPRMQTADERAQLSKLVHYFRELPESVINDDWNYVDSLKTELEVEKQKKLAKQSRRRRTPISYNKILTPEKV